MRLTREPLMEFGVKNINDRIYLVDEFTRKRTREILLDNPSGGEYLLEEYTLLDDFNEQASKGLKFGECTFGTASEINLKKATHKMERIYIEDNILYGDITILNLPKWHKYKNVIYLLDSFVFRSRGLGNVRLNCKVELEQLITFDATIRSNATYPYLSDENRMSRNLLIEKDLISGMGLFV